MPSGSARVPLSRLWQLSDERFPSPVVEGEESKGPPLQLVSDTEGEPASITPGDKATFEMGEVSVMVQYLSVKPSRLVV